MDFSFTLDLGNTVVCPVGLRWPSSCIVTCAAMRTPTSATRLFRNRDATRLHDEDEAPSTEKKSDATEKKADADLDEEPETSFLVEVKACLRVGLPLAVANLLERLSLWVTLSLIGHHGGADELGPASLASSVNNVLGTSVNIGLALAVQTLASQAAGVGDAQALNRVLQRAVPVSMVFSLPVMILLLALGPILRALHRPDEVAASASAYALTILPVAALTGVQRCLMAWLAALQITRPVLVINIALVPVHAVAALILVFKVCVGPSHPLLVALVSSRRIL